MTGIVIFIGAALVMSVVAVVLSARYRRFDPVTTFSTASVVPQASTTMLATPEEITREMVSSSNQYDDEDDLLDPRNDHHAQWTRDHASGDVAGTND